MIKFIKLLLTICILLYTQFLHTIDLFIARYR